MIAQAVFWVCVALAIYTYAGYPLCIVLRARAKQVPAVGSWQELPRIAVIIVARDEAAVIGKKIDTIQASDYPPDKLQIVIASDGSADQMAAVVKARCDPRVSLLEFALPRGKSACIADAIASTDAQVLVLTDARQMLDRAAIRLLVDRLADPDFGAISGALVLGQAGVANASTAVDAYWRYEKIIREAEARFDSAIGVTGALYALRRSAFAGIPAGIILDDVWIPMAASRQGFRIGFEVAARAYDLPSTDMTRERKRKVRTLAGNWQLIQLQPWLLNPFANRLWWEFWSHKVLRLIVPFTLPVMLAVNGMLALSRSLYVPIFAAQVGFYVLAFIGSSPRVASRNLPARICNTFLMLNWFAAEGLFQHVRNRSQGLWR